MAAQHALLDAEPVQHARIERDVVGAQLRRVQRLHAELLPRAAIEGMRRHRDVERDGRAAELLRVDGQLGRELVDGRFNLQLGIEHADARQRGRTQAAQPDRAVGGARRHLERAVDDADELVVRIHDRVRRIRHDLAEVELVDANPRELERIAAAAAPGRDVAEVGGGGHADVEIGRARRARDPRTDHDVAGMCIDLRVHVDRHDARIEREPFAVDRDRCVESAARTLHVDVRAERAGVTFAERAELHVRIASVARASPALL